MGSLPNTALVAMGWSYVSWLAKIMSPRCLGGVTRQESGDWILLRGKEWFRGQVRTGYARAQGREPTFGKEVGHRGVRDLSRFVLHSLFFCIQRNASPWLLWVPSNQSRNKQPSTVSPAREVVLKQTQPV